MIPIPVSVFVLNLVLVTKKVVIVWTDAMEDAILIMFRDCALKNALVILHLMPIQLPMSAFRHARLPTMHSRTTVHAFRLAPRTSTVKIQVHLV